jgi:ribosome biogenesis protein ERB1
MCRFDLDLSTKPYKVMRYHEAAVRSVAFHRAYPLFASGSDDGTVQVFHGMVYQDLMANPLVVPVKILCGHKVHEFSGVLGVCFHPSQPWVFTAGGDGNACLFIDV